MPCRRTRTCGTEGLGHDRNHRVDGVTPALLGVVANGTTVSLTFSDALDENSVPPASAFTVKKTLPKEGTEQTVSTERTRRSLLAGAVLLTLVGPGAGGRRET